MSAKGRIGRALDTPHADEWGDQPTIRYFPEHVISEATAAVLALAALTALCILAPAGLEVKADPTATPAGAKPEWYFLFVSAYLRMVPPIVGTLTPVVGMALLLLLPVLDRSPERRAGARVLAIAGSVALIAAVAALTIKGALE